MKHGFELHGFFLEPKTAYLEALLYRIFEKKIKKVAKEVIFLEFNFYWRVDFKVAATVYSIHSRLV